jgi:hypothetical protein
MRANIPTSIPAGVIRLIASTGLLLLLLAAVPSPLAQTPPPAGLKLWLKADAGVTVSADGSVTAWEDQSSNANHAGQLDEALAPKLVPNALNGKPVLRFDGADDFLDVPPSPSLEIVGDISSFFVVKFDDFQTFRAVWGKTVNNLPASMDYYIVPGSGIPRAYRGDGTSSSLGFVDASRAFRAATYLVAGFDMAGTQFTHYLGGQPLGTGNITAGLADSGLALKIGTRDDLFTKLKGDLAELLIYDVALSETDRNAVFDYLKNKYGILNLTPAVSLTGPANNSTVASPATVTMVADASDPDGSITKVDFFANGALVGTATAPPYRLPVAIRTPGTITLRAVATDDKDATGSSANVMVTATGNTDPSLTPGANLKLWLKADAGVTAGASGAVTEWSDQSSQNNHALQPDETLAPLLVPAAVNGKPAIRFDGTDDYLDVAHAESLAITGDISSFFVVKFDDFATFRAVWGKTGGNLPRPTDYYALPNSGVPRVFRGGDEGIGSVDGAGGLPTGTYALVGFSHAGTTLTHFLNGSAFGQGSLSAIPTDAGSPLKIGTRDDLFTKMKGDIAELLIYDSALSDSERDALTAYLGAKYGVPILASANAGPVVNLTAPSAPLSLVVPAVVDVTATATDSGGSVVRVEFLANGGLFATDTSSPYAATLNITTGGEIMVTAVAVDNFGVRTTSAPQVITATAPVPPPIPTDGLRLWLRADKGITQNAGGGVTGWEDASGNFNHARQTSEAAAPALIPNGANGQPVLRFDGADDGMEIAHSESLAITGDISSFFAVRFQDFDFFRAVWAKTESNQPRPTDYYVLPSSGLPRVFRGGPAGIGNVDAFEPFPVDTVLVGGFDMVGATVTHYLDGLVIGSGEITSAGGDTGRPLWIGTRDDQVTRMKGDIAEIVIYNRAISETERNQVVDYMKNRYGVGVAPRPSLAASRNGNTVVLSWPASETDFVVESSATVTGGWTAVTLPTVVQGDQNTVSITISSVGSEFFRLRKP